MNEDTEATKPHTPPVASPRDSCTPTGEAAIDTPSQPEAGTTVAEASAGSESEISSTPPASSDPPWNLGSLSTALHHDEKNPFSCMSEEDMSQIDAVLSSEEGKKILQQTSSPEFKIDPETLHDTGNGFAPLPGPAMETSIADTSIGLEVFNQTGVTDLNDSAANFELDDSLIQAGLKGDLTIDLEPSFSDHAYCLTPARISRQGSSRQASSEGEKEDADKPEDAAGEASSANVSEAGDGESARDIGTGKRAPSARPRRSTRIQDQEQREMAERIRQENIQKEQEAIQALRGEPIPTEIGGKGSKKSYNMRNRTPTQREIIQRVADRKKKLEKDGENQSEASQQDLDTTQDVEEMDTTLDVEEMDTTQDPEENKKEESQESGLDIVVESLAEEVIESSVETTGKGRGRGRGRGKQIVAKGLKMGIGRGKIVKLGEVEEGDDTGTESLNVGKGRGKKRAVKGKGKGSKAAGKKGMTKDEDNANQFADAEGDGPVKVKPKGKAKIKKTPKKHDETQETDSVMLPKKKGKKSLKKEGKQVGNEMDVVESSDENIDVSGSVARKRVPKGKKEKRSRNSEQDEEIESSESSSEEEEEPFLGNKPNSKKKALAMDEEDEEENEADNEGDDVDTPTIVRRGKKTKRAKDSGKQSKESDDSDSDSLAQLKLKKGKTKGKKGAKSKAESGTGSEVRSPLKGKRGLKKSSKSAEFVKSSSESSDEEQPLQKKEIKSKKGKISVKDSLGQEDKMEGSNSDSEGELPLSSLNKAKHEQVDVPPGSTRMKSAFRDPILMTGDFFKKVTEQSTLKDDKEDNKKTSLVTEKEPDGANNKSKIKRRIRGKNDSKENKKDVKDTEFSSRSKEEGDGSGSEDDPEKLWCICKKPYDNRFMISCDLCQDWFHGTCVGVTLQEAEEMVQTNQTWSCPPCTEKPIKPDKKEVQFKVNTKAKIAVKRVDSDIPVEADKADKSDSKSAVLAKIFKVKKKDSTVKQEDGSVENGSGTQNNSKAEDMETTTEVEKSKSEYDSGKQKTDVATEKVKDGKEKRSRSRENETPADTDRDRTQDSTAEKSESSSSKSKKKKERTSGEPCILSGCSNNARVNSVYCSNSCIMKHAQESLKLLDRQKRKMYGNRSKPDPKSEGISDPNERIMVIERKTGKILTGPNAPTAVMLKAWLERHPTYEVVQPGQNMAQAPGAPQSQRKEKEKKIERKDSSKERKDSKGRKDTPRAPSKLAQLETVEYAESKPEIPIQEQEQFQLQTSPENMPHPSHYPSDAADRGPDPFRIKVRKSFKDALDMRASASDDIMLTGGEIKNMAVNMEEELFRQFGGVVDLKYKSRYRSLIFHIRDPKNKGLFRRVLNGNIKIRHLVRMSDEQMMSFARYRDKVSKPQSRESASLVPGSRSHTWGKSLAELSQQPSNESSAQLKLGKTQPDYLGSLILDTTHQHKNHLFDLNCKVCTGKMTLAEAEAAHSHNRPALLPTPKDVPSHSKTKEEIPQAKREEKAASIVIPEKSPMEDLSSNTEVVPMEMDLDEEPVKPSVSHRDPRSRDPRNASRQSDGGAVDPGGAKAMEIPVKTVAESPKQESTSVVSSTTVSSPDSALQSGLDVKPRYSPTQTPVWKGVVYMQDLAKFFSTAYTVSGYTEYLSAELPDTVHIMGRLAPEQVYDYLNRIRNSGSREVLVVRLEAASEEEKHHYVQLYSYLSGRNRCGVVGQLGKILKDMYIVPLAAHSKIPSALTPFKGPGLPLDRPHLLLGIIIRLKLKRITGDPRRSRQMMKSVHPQHSSKGIGETDAALLHSGRDPRRQTKSTVASISTTLSDSVPVPCTTATPQPIAPKTVGPTSVPSTSITPKPVPSVTVIPQPVPPPVGVPKSVPLPETQSEEKDNDVDSAEEEADEIVLGFGKAGAERAAKPPRVKKVKENLPYEPGDDIEEDLSTSGRAVPNSAKEAKQLVTGPTEPTTKATTTPIGGIDMGVLLDKLGKTQNPAEMTAAMLATLAATASSSSLAEQQKLLMQLTEKVEEQKRMLEKKKEETVKLAMTANVACQQAGDKEHTLNSQATSSGTLTSTTRLSVPAATSLPVAVPQTIAEKVATPVLTNLSQVSPFHVHLKPPATELSQNTDTNQSNNVLELGTPTIIADIKESSSKEASKESVVTKMKEGTTLSSEENSNHSVQSGSGEVDSIINLARKRLEQKDVGQSSVKTANIASTAPTPNISLLPPALQYLLSGRSFEAMNKTAQGISGATVESGRQSPCLKPSRDVDNVPGYEEVKDTNQSKADQNKDLPGKLDVAGEMKKLKAGLADSDSDNDELVIFTNEEIAMKNRDTPFQDVKQISATDNKEKPKVRKLSHYGVDEEDELEAAMNNPGGWTAAMREERSKKALFYEDVGQEWVDEDYDANQVVGPSRSTPPDQQKNMYELVSSYQKPQPLPPQLPPGLDDFVSNPTAQSSKPYSSWIPTSVAISNVVTPKQPTGGLGMQGERSGIFGGFGHRALDGGKHNSRKSLDQTSFPLSDGNEGQEWDQIYDSSDQSKYAAQKDESMMRKSYSSAQWEMQKLELSLSKDSSVPGLGDFDAIPGLGNLIQTGKSIQPGNSLNDGEKASVEAESHLEKEQEDASIEESLYGPEENSSQIQYQSSSASQRNSGEMSVETMLEHGETQPNMDKGRFKAKMGWEGKQTAMQRKFVPLSETAKAAFRDTPSPEPVRIGIPQLKSSESQKGSVANQGKGSSDVKLSQTISSEKAMDNRDQSLSPVWSEENNMEIDSSNKDPPQHIKSPKRSSSKHRSESPIWPYSPERKHGEHRSKRREDKERRKKRRRSRSRSRSRDHERRRHRSRDRKRGRSRSKSSDRRRRKRSSDRKRRRSVDRDHRHRSPHRRRSPKRKRSSERGERRKESHSSERQDDGDKGPSGSDPSKWKRIGENVDDKEEGELSHDDLDHSVIDLVKSDEEVSNPGNKSLEPGELESDPELPDADSYEPMSTSPSKQVKDNVVSPRDLLKMIGVDPSTVPQSFFDSGGMAGTMQGSREEWNRPIRIVKRPALLETPKSPSDGEQVIPKWRTEPTDHFSEVGSQDERMRAGLDRGRGLLPHPRILPFGQRTMDRNEQADIDKLRMQDYEPLQSRSVDPPASQSFQGIPSETCETKEKRSITIGGIIPTVKPSFLDESPRSSASVIPGFDLRSVQTSEGDTAPPRKDSSIDELRIPGLGGFSGPSTDDVRFGTIKDRSSFQPQLAFLSQDSVTSVNESRPTTAVRDVSADRIRMFSSQQERNPGTQMGVESDRRTEKPQEFHILNPSSDTGRRSWSRERDFSPPVKRLRPERSLSPNGEARIVNDYQGEQILRNMMGRAPQRGPLLPEPSVSVPLTGPPSSGPPVFPAEVAPDRHPSIEKAVPGRGVTDKQLSRDPHQGLEIKQDPFDARQSERERNRGPMSGPDRGLQSLSLPPGHLRDTRRSSQDDHSDRVYGSTESRGLPRNEPFDREGQGRDRGLVKRSRFDIDERIHPEHRDIHNRGSLRRSPPRGPPNRGLSERRLTEQRSDSGIPDRLPSELGHPKRVLLEKGFPERPHDTLTPSREHKDQRPSRWGPPGPDQGPPEREQVERGRPAEHHLGGGRGRGLLVPPINRGHLDRGQPAEGLLEREPSRPLIDDVPLGLLGSGPVGRGRGLAGRRPPERDDSFSERSQSAVGRGRGLLGHGPPHDNRGFTDHGPSIQEDPDEDWVRPSLLERDDHTFMEGSVDHHGPEAGRPDRRPLGPRGPTFGPPRFSENFPRGPRPRGPGPYFRGGIRGGLRPPPRLMGPRHPHR